MDPEIREMMAVTQLDTMFIIRGEEQEAFSRVLPTLSVPKRAPRLAG
jgi:hypothetical protein